MAQLSKTVRLNVGGQRYEVARSTLELHPDTMLYRLAHKRWESDNDEPIFIDRDSIKFRYILDWMRDGKVNLPVTESFEAVRQELEYYGFVDVKDESINAGTLEGGQVMTTVSCNFYDALDNVDASIQAKEKEIKDLKNRKHAIRAAHTLFARSVNKDKGSKRVNLILTEKDECENARDALKVKDFFHECLANYGLKIVSGPSGHGQFYGNFEVELERKMDKGEGAKNKKRARGEVQDENLKFFD